MRVEIKNSNRCSCNFCDKGELSNDRKHLIYPYKEVITFRSEGSGLQASICKECLSELIEKSRKL